MPAIHLRTDLPLHGQLQDIARAEGLSLNSYLVRLVRADVSRRQRIAAAVGRDWRATDTELAEALAATLATPLSDIDQANLRGLSPEQAITFAARRTTAKKRSSKPAPSPATKPAPAPSTKPTTRTAAQTRSKTPGKVVLAASEYRALLARRAKRLGQAAQTHDGDGLVTVRGDDPDLLPHHRAAAS